MEASASGQAPKREARVDESEEDLLPVPIADPAREHEALVDVALRLGVPIVLGQEVDEVVVRAQRRRWLVVLDRPRPSASRSSARLSRIRPWLLRISAFVFSACE